MLEPVILTLLGGAVGAVATSLVERARFRNERARQDAERERDSKRAFRLVERELFDASTRIERVARAGHYGSPAKPWATSAFQAHEDVLAVELGVADWHIVTAAYDAIIDLNETLEARETERAAVRPEDLLERRWRAIRSAAWVLRAYAGEADKPQHALTEDERIAGETWPDDTASTAA